MDAFLIVIFVVAMHAATWCAFTDNRFRAAFVKAEDTRAEIMSLTKTRFAANTVGTLWFGECLAWLATVALAGMLIPDGPWRIGAMTASALAALTALVCGLVAWGWMPKLLVPEPWRGHPGRLTRLGS